MTTTKTTPALTDHDRLCLRVEERIRDAIKPLLDERISKGSAEEIEHFQLALLETVTRILGFLLEGWPASIQQQCLNHLHEGTEPPKTTGDAHVH